MSVTGLVGSSSVYHIPLPARGTRASHGCKSSHPIARMLGRDRFSQLDGKSLAVQPTRQLQTRQLQRRMQVVKCAMDASFGDATNDQFDVFPRINIKDPYKRLGISSEASSEEIQAARKFLLQRYASHKPSVDSIEAAYDKIIRQSFDERKRPKLNIKKKVRDVTQSKYLQAIMNRFSTPANTKFIVTTAVTFLVLGALTILFPTEEGPTLQVAISLMATIYFIHSRLKSKIRSLLYGFGAFAFSWLLGTFLMVSVIPPVLNGFRSFEVMSSLISYVLLWVASTYLK